jgi:uncharacterized protein
MRLGCARANSFILAVIGLLIFSPLLVSSTLAAEPKFPALTGRVVDDAGVLSASTQSTLTDMLAAHERATGQQVVVVTLDSLQGLSIEDYGYQLGRYWGIGQKGKNTGAMLIVAPKDHKVRIEVGYGLEGALTDAMSSTIIRNQILPSFRSGDFDAGILAGTRSILQVLGGSENVDAEINFPTVDSGNSELGLLAMFVLLALVLLANRLGGRSRQDYIRRMGGTVGPGSNFGGSFGGGGFLGGGGSFGGGGASGSW